MAKPFQRFRQFLAELKRRHVYRVAATYLVVAFVGIQAVNLLIPDTTLPVWTDRLLLAVLVVGFPVAVVVAWAFELSPGGVRRTQSADARDTAASSPGSSSRAASAPAAEADRPRPEKSVAVLPFADMSPDRDHDYFGEGLAEEVLNALAQLEDLEVASRTSAFAYQRRDADIREIGRDLGVATVVEGSVRRAGDRLRITAQLVEADGGYHLWSETFDRELEDVFAIQDEITASVVEALQVELLGEEPDRLSRVSTSDADAYDLYLKGRHYWQRRYEVSLETALEYFDQALEKDPEFALAHAGRAEAYWVLGVYGMVEPGTVRRRAIEASERAVELGPALPECYCARGLVLGDIEHDLGGGIEAFGKALELDSSHARAEVWRSFYRGAWRNGDREKAERDVRRAVELDPDSIYVRGAAATAYLIMDRYEEAARQADEVLRREPEAVLGLWTRALVHTERGEHETAIEQLERAAALTNQASFVVSLLGAARGRAGQRDEALDVLQRLGERQRDGEYIAPLFLAAVEAHVDRTKAALDHLHEHVSNGYPGLGPLLPAGALDVLRGEPRFDELLKVVEIR